MLLGLTFIQVCKVKYLKIKSLSKSKITDFKIHSKKFKYTKTLFCNSNNSKCVRGLLHLSPGAHCLIIRPCGQVSTFCCILPIAAWSMIYDLFYHLDPGNRAQTTWTAPSVCITLPSLEQQHWLFSVRPRNCIWGNPSSLCLINIKRFKLCRKQSLN